MSEISQRIGTLHKLQEEAYLVGNQVLLAEVSLELDELITPDYLDTANPIEGEIGVHWGVADQRPYAEHRGEPLNSSLAI